MANQSIRPIKSPAFAQPLHVGRPNIGNQERFLSRISEIMGNRWFTNSGPFLKEFEQRIAEMVGAKHCIAMCNATIALEIAVRAAGLKGEVIVPAYTFIATAHALQWQEITPVFCDLDPKTHNIDPLRVEELITPRTSGIIGVHLWGNPCAIEELSEIAERRGLALLFDAAQAFGCSHKGKMVGSFGLAEVFSFHATKFFNTFEGGAVITNNDELARKIRLMKNFGFAGYDNVVYIGTNGKMTEICAAMGLTNLESLEHFITVNRLNYDTYQKELAGIPGLSLVQYDHSEKRNYHYVVAEVDENITRHDRNEIIQVLHSENVLARKYFWPGCHQMEPYRSFFPHAKLLLPQTEMVAARTIVLPNGTSVGPDEIKRICAIIRDVIKS
ncbi:MAG: DegT/DnrJ/EryC1/StrS family aminotransferase [Verrucomicrobiota bacterium]